MAQRHATATGVPVIARLSTEIERREAREAREERSLHQIVAVCALGGLLLWGAFGFGVVRALTEFQLSKLF